MAKAGKTHKSMAKRIKVTKTGKLRHSKTMKSHLLFNKGRSTKRDTLGTEISVADRKNVRALIPFKLR